MEGLLSLERLPGLMLLAGRELGFLAEALAGSGLGTPGGVSSGRSTEGGITVGAATRRSTTLRGGTGWTGTGAVGLGSVGRSGCMEWVKGWSTGGEG